MQSIRLCMRVTYQYHVTTSGKRRVTKDDRLAPIDMQKHLHFAALTLGIMLCIYERIDMRR